MCRNTLSVIKYLTLSVLLAVTAVHNLARAQQADLLADDPNLIVLTDQKEEYNLVKHGVITIDEFNSMSYRDVVKQHLQRQDKSRSTKYAHSIHIANNPTWVVFPVVNDSETEDWFISIGDYWEGRTGLSKAFNVYEALSQKVLYFSNENNIQESYNTSVIPINIPKGQEALFVVQYVPEDGSLSHIPFRLITQTSYLERADHFFDARGIIFASLSFGILFFISFTRSQSNRNYLVFVLFYILAFCGFITKQNILVSTHVWAPFFPYIIASIMTYLVPAMCTFYLSTKLKKSGFGLALRATAYIPIVALIIACVTFDDGKNFALFTSAANVITYCVLLGISIHFAFQRFQIAFNLVFGFLFIIAGTIISVLAHTDIITPLPWRIASFEYALIPLTFVFAYSTHIKTESVLRSLQRRLDMHEIEDPILNELKQSKESANQERLLRVIERERQSLEQMRYQEQIRREEMAVAKEEADLANRSKSAFLAMISHEIRTPMNGVMGMVRLMLDTKLSKEQHDYALTIQDSGDAMITLLNDILDFEKIETGKLDLEAIDFDIQRLIQGVATLMKGHAANKDVDITYDIDDDVPQYLVGDPTRIRQVLLNLTGNAIKFTETGHVKIIAKASKVDLSEGFDLGAEGFSEEYVLYLAVEDTGIGIEKEAQKTLFDPFSQADTSITRRYGGSGLGLAICQGIIEKMNSTIRIKSIVGEGSTFYFSVKMPAGMAPIEQSDTAAKDRLERERAEASNVPPQRILVVEDNQINQKVLVGILAKDGHTVTAVSTPEQVFEQMRIETYDLVLMDIELGNANGMDITRKIRALSNEEVAKTPVVAMTGHTDDESRQHCFDSGMNDFITKPVIPETLRDMIKRLIEGNLAVMDAEPKLVPQSVLSESDKIQEHKINILAAQEDDFDLDTYEVDDDFDSFAEALSNRLDDEDEDDIEAEPKEEFLDDETSIFGDQSTLQNFASLKEDPFKTFSDYEEKPSYSIETMDSAEQSSEQKANDPVGDGALVFDENMLGTLKDSLGADQVKELVSGLFEQAETIQIALDTALKGDDFKSIHERAHEMKGMAGNFGLMELSDIAGQLEKHIKNSDNAPDKTFISNMIEKKIPEAHKKAHTTLYAWLDA